MNKKRGKRNQDLCQGRNTKKKLTDGDEIVNEWICVCC